MADFELLAPGGHQKLVDEVVDRLDLKADIDGYYAQLTAGAADNLTGRGDAVAAEFLYRTAGGTADIETGQAVAKSIKGNTLVWNQLVKPNPRSVTSKGVTYTNTSDGKATLDGTATDAESFTSSLAFSVVSGHKYVYRGADVARGVYATVNGIGSNLNSDNIYTATVDVASTTLSVVIHATYTGTYEFYPQLFDLTAMFGSGNEPSTVAEFEALYPLSYYEYDAGSLLSVNMEGVETVGFNQWDEQWESGEINTNTGVDSADAGKIRSKDYIPIFAGMEYYAKSPAPTYLFFYDADKNYLGFHGSRKDNATFTPASLSNALSGGGSFASAVYMRFRCDTATYNNNICINLSWSGRRNGEYEPYWSAQREIAASTYFPDGMRSVGSIYDELTSTEAITRVGVVDLGTLNWSLYNGVFFAQISTMNINGNQPVQCAAYTVDDSVHSYAGAQNMADKSTAGGNGSGGGYVYVKDSAYTGDAAFKTAMSGVMLYYELATPVVTPIDPALNLSYRVDDFGTERIMVPEDERSAPPVLDIAYGLNVVDFVRRAPSEYISAASFRQYLLARDAHDGTTTTMAWDDTDNRYEFTITDVETEG